MTTPATVRVWQTKVLPGDDVNDWLRENAALIEVRWVQAIISPSGEIAFAIIYREIP